jgi:VIT1/CCC1 family predicted Fe2+/Mn2+ transporter
MTEERDNLKAALKAWAWAEAARYVSGSGETSWEIVYRDIQNSVNYFLVSILAELEALYNAYANRKKIDASAMEAWVDAIEKKRQEPWTLGGEHGE